MDGIQKLVKVIDDLPKWLKITIAVFVVLWLIGIGAELLLIPAVIAFFAWKFWGRNFVAEQRRAGSKRRELDDTRELFDEVVRLGAQDAGLDDEELQKLGGRIVSKARLDDEMERERAYEVVETLYYDEGLGSLPNVNWANIDMADRALLHSDLEYRKRLWRDRVRYVGLFEDTLVHAFQTASNAVPEKTRAARRENGGAIDPMEVPVAALMEDAGNTVSEIIVPFFADGVQNAGLFASIRDRVDRNCYEASGIEYEKRETTQKTQLMPYEVDGTGEQLVQWFLNGTVLEDLLSYNVPFSIPISSKFEHTMVLAGSGHGKTQTMQRLLVDDLEEVRQGNASVVVIDSQGDLINKIARLEMFAPDNAEGIADRLMLIDPNEVENPPALNMFDINMERINSYSANDRERIMNGTIELYTYIFGALLGAEMTQKQSVIFGFLARLMLVIPDATIVTLREVMENGEPFRPYMDKLDGTAQQFFETQFFHKSFVDTKQQILRRLWGVLGNPSFERMFANRSNKVDMFAAINSGSVVLVNTAKDFLQPEWSEIFGRFFIALVTQAAIQRAVLPESKRLNTYLYIDEAHEYFDDNLEMLLNQARKYRVGITMSSQNTDQMSTSIRSTMLASTSVKLVGGANAKDARLMASEMHCDAEYIQSMKKRERQDAEFACMVRNVTPRAVRLSVPFGVMEALPAMNDEQYQELLKLNRARVCDAGGIVEDTGERHEDEYENVFELGKQRAI